MAMDAPPATPDEMGRRIAAEFRAAVRAARPGLSFRLTIFGSRARGDSDEQSDVDLLVEVDVDRLGREVHAVLSDAAADLSLKYGVVVSLVELDRELARAREGFPFLRTIRKEGIAA
jgi:predicted nucleotidyltransferase